MLVGAAKPREKPPEQCKDVSPTAGRVSMYKYLFSRDELFSSSLNGVLGK